MRITAGVTVLILLAFVAKADYVLRIDLKDYSNPTNSLSNGSCCDPRCGLNSMAAQCCTNDSCNLATRICFRGADHPHTPEGECTRGEFTSLYLRHSNNPSGNFYVRGPTAPNAEVQVYIRFFHLVNRNGVQQTSLDPTIDEFYYDGGAHPRTLSLSGVHGKAQISALLQYRCDSGYCGSICEEHCQEDGDRTDASIDRPTNYTAPDLNSNTQQNSASRVSLSTESIITIVASSAVGILVLVGLIVLLIVNLTIARKLKGKVDSLEGTKICTQSPNTRDNSTTENQTAYEHIVSYVI